MGDKDIESLVREIRNLVKDIDQKVDYVIEKLRELFFRH